MKRRGFIAALLSFLGFGLAPAKAPEPHLRKVFRQTPTKEGPFWEEIAWEDMHVGDRILLVGDILEIGTVDEPPCEKGVAVSNCKRLQA